MEEQQPKSQRWSRETEREKRGELLQDWWMWDPVWLRLYAWVTEMSMYVRHEKDRNTERQKKVTQNRQNRDREREQGERKKERQRRDGINVWAWRVTEQSRCIKGNAPPSFLYTHTHAHRHFPLHCQHSSKHAFSESEWAVNGERGEGWARGRQGRRIYFHFKLNWGIER